MKSTADLEAMGTRNGYISPGLQKLNPSPEDCQVEQRDDFGQDNKKILAHEGLLFCCTAVCVVLLQHAVVSPQRAGY